MNLIKFLLSSVFFKNIFYIIILTIIVVFGVFFGLGFATQHNKYVKVPELFGLNISKAIETLKNTFTELGEELGKVIIPVAIDLAKRVTEILKKFSNLDERTKKVIVVFGLFLAALAPLLMVIGSVSTGLGSLIALGTKLSPIIKTLAKRFAALNISLAANPYVLAAIAIAAVTAAVPIVLVTILPEAIACCVIIPDAKAVLAAIPPAATSVAFTAPVAISAAPTAPSTIFVFATELFANPSNLILDKPPILVLLFYLSIYPKAIEKANESATDPN